MHFLLGAVAEMWPTAVVSQQSITPGNTFQFFAWFRKEKSASGVICAVEHDSGAEKGHGANVFRSGMPVYLP